MLSIASGCSSASGECDASFSASQRDGLKRLESGGLRRDQLRAVDLARPAAIVDVIEIHEADQIGLRLDDLAGCACP